VTKVAVIKESESVTLEQVVSLARQLPPLDKVHLIERIAPDIERDMHQQQPLKSLLADRVRRSLGPAPSAEDIDEIRREMWGNIRRYSPL
jgi:hypothetical protein